MVVRYLFPCLITQHHVGVVAEAQLHTAEAHGQADRIALASTHSEMDVIVKYVPGPPTRHHFKILLHRTLPGLGNVRDRVWINPATFAAAWLIIAAPKPSSAAGTA